MTHMPINQGLIHRTYFFMPKINMNKTNKMYAGNGQNRKYEWLLTYKMMPRSFTQTEKCELRPQ